MTQGGQKLFFYFLSELLGVNDLHIKIALSILDKCNKNENNYKFFTPKALEEIRLYDWPGNVRELTNTIQRAHVLAQHNEIDTKDLWKDRPLQNRQVPELPVFYEGFSVESHINQYRQRIYEAALEAGRTQVEAANILGVSLNGQQIHQERGNNNSS
jgi:DNA-binding NtrC family response regulator